MEKEFVTYELALRMKQLGFDESCFGYYVDGELRGINLGIEELGGVEPYYQRFGFHTLSNHNIDNQNKIVVTAPTYQQAFRWFREKFDWTIKVNQVTKTNWSYTLKNFPNERTYYGKLYETFEEAELACLTKLIEIVENQ